jgi:hypothetical protein
MAGDTGSAYDNIVRLNADMLKSGAITARNEDILTFDACRRPSKVCKVHGAVDNLTTFYTTRSRGFTTDYVPVASFCTQCYIDHLRSAIGEVADPEPEAKQ